jgi:hypothetical protein
MSNVKGVKLGGDKIMRLHAQTAIIENGFVHLPDEAHWLAHYLAELAMFPAGRHDDQVDSTAQALAWAKQWAAVPGIIEYYRQPAEDDDERLDPRVRYVFDLCRPAAAVASVLRPARRARPGVLSSIGASAARNPCHGSRGRAASRAGVLATVK